MSGTGSLQELFDRDPLKLTDEDVDTIVAQLREQRKNFQLKESAPKALKTPKAKTEKVAVSAEAVKDMSLDDLGL